jgi:hypothetical protein
MNRRTFFFAGLGGCALALSFLLLTSGSAPTALAMSQAPAPSVQTADFGVTSSIPTTITLASSPNPASIGQTVNITATVFIPPRSGIPTGTIQFKVDGANFGAAVNLSNRKAGFSTSWSSTGWHYITAVYSGDANFDASTSVQLSQIVGSLGGTNTQDSFILSNEPPGYLIHKLIVAGYGNYNLYDCLVMIRNDTGGSSQAIPDAFLAALRNAPVTSEIFTIPLNQFDFDGAVAVSTDGTARIVDIFGQDYTGKPTTTTLRTVTSGVGKTNFVTSNNPQVPLNSWYIVTSYYGGVIVITSTYNAFAVAWGDFYSLYLPILVR